VGNRLGRALGAALLMLSVSAGAVLAGEVTGTGEPTPIKSGQANSICAFSGLNDHPEGDPEEGPGGRTQSFGQVVKMVGPLGGIPGTECNPTRAEH
jgi:hypothetical protein